MADHVSEVDPRAVSDPVWIIWNRSAIGAWRPAWRTSRRAADEEWNFGLGSFLMAFAVAREVTVDPTGGKRKIAEGGDDSGCSGCRRSGGMRIRAAGWGLFARLDP
jgi:hypothetical protein